MRIIVRGETYDLARVTLGEAGMLERATGKTFEALQKDQSVVGMQALVWVAMKRVHHGMRFNDTDDIALDDIVIELDDEAETVAAEEVSDPLDAEQLELPNA